MFLQVTEDTGVTAGGDAVPASAPAAGHAVGAASGQAGMGPPNQQPDPIAGDHQTTMKAQGAKLSLLQASMQTDIRLTLLAV